MNLEINDKVFDKSYPLEIGIVTKVLKTRTTVRFISGTTYNSKTVKYDNTHKKRFLVKIINT